MDYDGGWAQYALAREDTLLPIPDHLPFDQAAITPDAVSTPYAAIVDTGAVRPAQAVGIWGAGGLSAHGIRLARVVGAAPVIAVDPLPSARERALLFGADHALDPMAGDFAEAVREATAGRGIDVAFEFALSYVGRAPALPLGHRPADPGPAPLAGAGDHSRLPCHLGGYTGRRWCAKRPLGDRSAGPTPPRTGTGEAGPGGELRPLPPRTSDALVR